MYEGIEKKKQKIDEVSKHTWEVILQFYTPKRRGKRENMDGKCEKETSQELYPTRSIVVVKRSSPNPTGRTNNREFYTTKRRKETNLTTRDTQSNRMESNEPIGPGI